METYLRYDDGTEEWIPMAPSVAVEKILRFQREQDDSNVLRTPKNLLEALARRISGNIFLVIDPQGNPVKTFYEREITPGLSVLGGWLSQKGAGLLKDINAFMDDRPNREFVMTTYPELLEAVVRKQIFEATDLHELQQRHPGFLDQYVLGDRATAEDQNRYTEKSWGVRMPKPETISPTWTPETERTLAVAA